MRIILLLTATAVFAAAQPTRSACALSASAEKAVQALPSLQDLSLSWEQRMAPRRALAEREPNNWPLQFLLQDAFRNYFHIGREWDHAIAFYRRLPDRVLGELLEARLISGFHRKRSRDMIERVLIAAPNSPWSHLAAAEWSARPVGRDVDFGARHLEEFRRLCPASPRAFAMLDLVQNPERLAHHVRDLRNLIESKKPAGVADADLFLFRAAWPWEKAAAGTARETYFQRTIRSDLAAIRAARLYQSPEWYSALRFGYEQLIKDPASLEALKEEIRKRAPTSQTAWWLEEERAPKQPPPGTAREQMERWRVERNAALHERIRRFGHQPFVRFAIHRVLFDPMSKLEDAEVERLSDLLLEQAARYPDQGATFPPVHMLIADTYTRRKLRLDRVPNLVQQALEEIEYQEKHRRDSDAIPRTAGMIDNIAVTQSRARDVLIRHAIATQQTAKAQAMLADLRRTLDQTKPAGDAGPQAMTWRRNRSTYLELAELAGIEADPLPELPPQTPARAERFPVAEFEAKDLSGRTWRLADLKGKVAYVNIWTTWCGPCRAEMPGIQQLHDRWKDRNDRIVLTISADLHEALVRDFLREYKYTFPAIQGTAVAEKFFPPISFPQNWFIDPDGRRLNLNAPRAHDSTLAQIERIADQIAAPAN